MTIVSPDFLFVNAAFCPFFAAFDCGDKFAVPSLFCGKDANLRNVKRKPDLGSSRNGHLLSPLVTMASILHHPSIWGCTPWIPKEPEFIVSIWCYDWDISISKLFGFLL